MGILGGVGVDIKKHAGAVVNMIKGWKWLATHEALVGIPEENSQRGTDDGGSVLTNAQLMYIHENGSPANNIPPRPVIQMGLMEEETMSRIKEYLGDGSKKALKGDVAGAQKDWERAGMVGVNSVMEKFTDGSLAPNAPSTIARKGSSTPLIDTGALRQSITYVVRKKK